MSDVVTGFHKPEIEKMPRDQLETIQLQRLQTTVRRLRERVPLMAERLDGIGNPSSLDDLAGLPFLKKSDLRDTYPFGLFASERAELARIHASSGTSGKPTVVG
ncbi:MAG: phenylacetate--CoA ligase family protein, partial [Acidimicrobiia bacterium]